jgi:DnaJ family protein C protein 9
MSGVLAEIQELFGDKSFYEILNIQKEASKNEIRKAYYQLSLKVHPDRAPANQRKKATKEFQALAKIYEVLSDDGKRALYDEEGSVDDECDAFSNERNWNEYWRLLFPRVNLDDINKFTTQYKGSSEELEELKQAYINSQGDMDHIIDSVMCATVEDEPRFREILKGLIDEGTLTAYSAFTLEKKSKQEARKRRAQAEEKEAEQMRKKLGKTEEQSLFSLIQRNQKSRGEQADAFFSYMESKYGCSKPHDSPSPAKKLGANAGKKSAAGKTAELPRSDESVSSTTKGSKKSAGSPAKKCKTTSQVKSAAKKPKVVSKKPARKLKTKTK